MSSSWVFILPLGFEGFRGAGSPEYRVAGFKDFRMKILD